MRTDNMRESGNVEDRRGQSGGRNMAIGGGLGGIVIILLVVLLGGNPQQLLNQMNTGGGPMGGGGGAGAAPYTPTPQEAQAERVARRVLGDTEQVWGEVFAKMGRRYEPAKMVLYRGGTPTGGCGFGQASYGPFYCPADKTIYIDLSFFAELSAKYGAPGDFAQAYVIAHEVGHHVQNLMGWSRRVDEARGRVSEEEVNALSVRLELQADFLAGVWAHHANRDRQILEVGDIDEGLAAAAAVGDDRLQKEARGYAVPESFTHGTSAQRARWFRLGLETGDLNRGDTFSANPL